MAYGNNMTFHNQLHMINQVSLLPIYHYQGRTNDKSVLESVFMAKPMQKR